MSAVENPAPEHPAISITVSGEPRTVNAATAAELFAAEPTVVVARINGSLVDLTHPLTEGDSVQPGWMCCAILRRT